MSKTLPGKWPHDRRNTLINRLLEATTEKGNVLEEHVVLQASPVQGSVESEPRAAEFMLGQNYPNPFNPRTMITYSLGEAAHVRITVVNTLGQVIEKVIDEYQASGSHSIVWPSRDGNTDLPGGMYFYRLDAVPLSNRAGWSEVRKMVLLK